MTAVINTLMIIIIQTLTQIHSAGPGAGKLIKVVSIYTISFFVPSLHFNHASTHKQML